MNKIAKSALALGLIGAVSLPALAAGTDGGAYIGGGLSIYQDSDTDGQGNFARSCCKVLKPHQVCQYMCNC